MEMHGATVKAFINMFVYLAFEKRFCNNEVRGMS
jgi:hypothetical protein